MTSRRFFNSLLKILCQSNRKKKFVTKNYVAITQAEKTKSQIFFVFYFSIGAHRNDTEIFALRIHCLVFRKTTVVDEMFRLEVCY